MGEYFLVIYANTNGLDQSSYVRSLISALYSRLQHIKRIIPDMSGKHKQQQQQQ